MFKQANSDLWPDLQFSFVFQDSSAHICSFVAHSVTVFTLSNLDRFNLLHSVPKMSKDKILILKKGMYVFQMVSPNIDVLQTGRSRWSLCSIPLVEGYLSVMDGDPLQEVIKAVIEQVKSHVQPKISSFQKGNNNR